MSQPPKWPEPLADWEYTPGEWAAFVRQERQQLRTEFLLVTIGILIFGTILLRILRQAPLWAAFLVSFVVALVYGFVRYQIHAGFLAGSGKNRVMIYPHAARINGRWLTWSSSNRKLDGITIRHETDSEILEITYCWNTRSGPASDEVRIPIPQGKLEEARKLLDELRKNP